MQKNLAPVLERVCRSHCWIATPEGPRHLREPLDDFKIQAHLQGIHKYGACPITPGTSTTRIGLLDLDSHNGESTREQMIATALDLIEMAKHGGLEAVPFRSSGGKGIHLFFLWDTPQDAYSVRIALRGVLEASGFKDGTAGVAAKSAEVFPKQSRVEADKFGSMFWLPFAGHSIPFEVTDA